MRYLVFRSCDSLLHCTYFKIDHIVGSKALLSKCKRVPGGVSAGYIGIHVPCWFAAPINSSFTLGISPNAIPPLVPQPLTGSDV